MRLNAVIAMTIFLALGLPIAGFPVAAHANGATASFPAGGVMFKQDEDISIAREDLEIGLERIRVHYVFNSSASQPLERTIGFPMAKVWMGDGTDELTGRSASKTDLRNYMAVKVKVNGSPIQPELHEYAWRDGVNITEWLRARDVPVFPVWNGRDFGLRHLPESTVEELVEANLAERSDPLVEPRWQYQTVYEWRQTFPPGDSEVEISYTPLYGVVTTEGKYALFPDDGDNRYSGDDRYCYDDAFKARFEQTHAYMEPLTLGYILKTAKNWTGPIGEFHLKVNNPEDYLFSFCPPAGLKPGADKWTWEARNFVPEADIDMIFLRGSER